MKNEWLTRRFEENRPRLRAVAHRMLGSAAEADDAVQEAWLRFSRADTSDVDNLDAWLTTVVSRVCLNVLQARKTRREEPLEPVRELPGDDDPVEQAELADSVGAALQVVLDTLTPPERLAFVLHDLFGLPFDEIAPIVERTPAAARQLASRARRRVRFAGSEPDAARGRAVVDAFLAASRDGDFDALLALLDPDVVLRADAVAVAGAKANAAVGAPALEPEMRGRQAVLDTFAGRARGAIPALIDGAAGAVAFMQHRRPGGLFTFTVTDGLISEIGIVVDPDAVAERDVQLV